MEWMVVLLADMMEEMKVLILVVWKVVASVDVMVDRLET